MDVFPRQRDWARVVEGKHEISDRSYALFEDPQGNAIGVWEWKL